eukprot:4995071-Amphidinium_carterae.1
MHTGLAGATLASSTFSLTGAGLEGPSVTSLCSSSCPFLRATATGRSVSVLSWVRLRLLPRSLRDALRCNGDVSPRSVHTN